MILNNLVHFPQHLAASRAFDDIVVFLIQEGVDVDLTGLL